MQQERIVAVNRIVIARNAVDRTRIIGMMLDGAPDEFMRVSGRRLDMEVIATVDDGVSVDLARNVTHLAQLVEHRARPIVRARCRRAVRQMHVSSPNESDQDSPNRSNTESSGLMQCGENHITSLEAFSYPFLF